MLKFVRSVKKRCVVWRSRDEFVRLERSRISSVWYLFSGYLFLLLLALVGFGACSSEPNVQEKPCSAKQKLCGDNCVDITRHSLHCGGCNRPCSDGQFCKESVCSFCSLQKPSLCGHTCVQLEDDPKNCGECGERCEEGLLCLGGVCSCPSGLQYCGGQCVALESHAEHCGKCDAKCPSQQHCLEGLCTTTDCPKGYILCRRGCVVLRSHPLHCGKCGHSCRWDEVCRAGRCGCPPGLKACDGKCVRLATSHSHCGKCGRVCRDGTYCVNGRCVGQCPSSTPDQCFGGCFNLENEPSHCGACGQKCRPGSRCLQGKCLCADGLHSCGKSCVDLQADGRHCGACGKSCPVGLRCAIGKCVKNCPKDTPDICGRGCYDLQNNDRHCGECQKACLGGTRCEKGRCSCPKGTQLCQGVCVDLKANGSHCGKCDFSCPTSQICTKGECKALSSCDGVHQRICRGGCVDLTTNAMHCGMCGNPCARGQVCFQRKCRSKGVVSPEIASESGQFEVMPETALEYSADAQEQVMDGGEHTSERVERPVERPVETTPEVSSPDKPYTCKKHCFWLISFGDQGNDRIEDFAFWNDVKTGKTYAYITGFFDKTITLPAGQVKNAKLVRLNTNGRLSAFVARLDLDSLQYDWANRILPLSTKASVTPRGIAVDFAGNAFSAGSFYDKAQFGTTTLTSKGDADAYVAQFSGQDGAVKWQAIGIGDGKDIIKFIANGPKGSLFVSGQLLSKKFSFDAQGSSFSIQNNDANKSSLFFATLHPTKGRQYLKDAPRRMGHVSDNNFMDNMVSSVGGLSGSLALMGTFAKANQQTLHGFAGETYTKANLTSETVALGFLKSDGKISHWKTNTLHGQTLFGTSSKKSEGIALALDNRGIAPDLYVLGCQEGDFGWKTKSKSITLVAASRQCFLSKFSTQSQTPQLVWSTALGEKISAGSTIRPASMVMDSRSPGKPLYIVGQYKGTVRFGATELKGGTHESQRMFIARYQNHQFEVMQIVCKACFPRRIRVDNNGHVYVSGHYSGTLTYKTSSITSKSSYDGFLLKLPVKW